MNNNILNITIGFKSGRSYLKDAFFTPPFRVADVSERRSDPSHYLMIQSSSPGILDRDHYQISVETEPNSRLQLQSQSYQRLFKMERGARQNMTIDLRSGSVMSYVPHPVVPHEASIFESHNIIRMETDSVFIYGEIITCGRKLSGEMFRFKKFKNLTEVYLEGKLLVKDNILIEPERMDVHSLGMMEGYTHQGTLLYVNARNEEIDPEPLHDRLAQEEGVIFGLSKPHPNTVIIRLLGNGGEQLYNAFKSIEALLWEKSRAESQS